MVNSDNRSVLAKHHAMVDPLIYHELLNSTAYEVKVGMIKTPEVQSIIDTMLAIANGKGYNRDDTRQVVGLAAPQVGIDQRIILVDITASGAHQEQNLTVIINPEIKNSSSEMIDGREGCWSCGDICGNVERAKAVIVTGFDRNALPVEYELTDFVARIAQHEVDHLNGMRFPDRIPLDQPHRLHIVRPEEFERYRHEWQNWPTLCKCAEWDNFKHGKASSH